MNQTLLFSIGVVVFAITVVATLLYGYFALDRIYQAEVAENPVTDDPTPVLPAHLPAPRPLVVPALVPAID